MEVDESMIWTTRFVIQKILVPIVVIFGIFGNTISIIVLTRSWMRCSTNYYLTALAVYDTLYLIFAMIMSLSHYTVIKDKTWYLLYQYPIGKPLVDTFSNTAVWLTITFTIERWICVCLPIRGRVWCTPKRAKRVITAVCIVTAIITLPEFFENAVALDNDYEVQKEAIGNKYSLNGSQIESMISQQSTNRSRILNSDPEFINDNPIAIDSMGSLDLNEEALFSDDLDKQKWIIRKSDMALSSGYRVGYVLTCQILFTFLPLIILLIFNSILISSVYGAGKRRKAMVRYTNQQTRKQEKTIREQQRVTITLIAVVIMFILTQTPQAVQNIYSKLAANKLDQQRNILLITGNVFNLLVMINSSINFVLYSTFNTKFRKTVRKLSSRRGRTSNSKGEVLYKKTVVTSQLSADPTACELQPVNGFKHRSVVR